jgi:hypothetical protein
VCVRGPLSRRLGRLAFHAWIVRFASSLRIGPWGPIFSAAVQTVARKAATLARGSSVAPVLSDQTLTAWSFAVATLTISDRFDAALEHTDAALATARESGSLPMFQLASWLRAWAQYRRGALAEAEARGSRPRSGLSSMCCSSAASAPRWTGCSMPTS